jgi:opacity protein-like surface antigen
MVLASANLRGELPTRVRWLLPYVVGGIGVANVRTRGFIAATENDLALAAGGGIDFNVFRNMWIDVGVRYQRVLASAEDLNVTRFGTAVGYRF